MHFNCTATVISFYFGYDELLQILCNTSSKLLWVLYGEGFGGCYLLYIMDLRLFLIMSGSYTKLGGCSHVINSDCMILDMN